MKFIMIVCRETSLRDVGYWEQAHSVENNNERCWMFEISTSSKRI